MINSEELVFVVDSNNNPLEAKTRSETHANHYWHRTAHVWIVNLKGEVLCQKRSLLKDNIPGLWEPFFGGHLSPKEEYINAALKEVQEELGIVVNKKDLKYFDLFKSETANEFQGIFYLPWKDQSNTFNLEKEEVEEVKWYELNVLKDLMNKKNWVFSEYSFRFLSYLREEIMVTA